MQYVYILKSQKDNKLYVGCTHDLENRLLYHNKGRVKSTKHRIPFDLLHFEKYEDKYEAFNREKYYKTIKGKKELKVLLKI